MKSKDGTKRVYLYFHLNVFFILVILSACDKPNPHPELLDPIYADLQREVDATKREVEQEIKKRDDLLAEAKLIPPQTGQNKRFQKKWRDANALINKLQQKATFLHIQLDSRKKVDRREYLDAYRNKTPWPQPKEYENYKRYRALETRSKIWSVVDRLEEYRRQNRKKTTSHEVEREPSSAEEEAK